MPDGEMPSMKSIGDAANKVSKAVPIKDPLSRDRLKVKTKPKRKRPAKKGIKATNPISDLKWARLKIAD